MPRTNRDVLEVTNDHSVPMSVPGQGTFTISVLSGNTLFYSDSYQVSAANNLGSITAGGSQSFTGPMWVKSAGLSALIVSRTPAVIDGSTVFVSGAAFDPMGVVSVKHPSFGAKGDGLVNDDAAFAAWVNALNATGGIGFVPAGRYILTQSWPTITHSNIEFKFSRGALLDWSGAAASITFVTVAGTEGSPVALTGNATEGQTSLSVTAGAEAGFPAGTYIRLGSSAIYDPGQSSTPKGELNLVTSTSSGAINLLWQVQGDAYNTVDTAQISAIAPVVGVVFDGIRILGGGTGQVQRGMNFDRCRQVRISNQEIIGCDDQAINITDTIDANVSGGHIQDSSRAATGYGIDVIGASQDVRIDGVFFQDCKHSVTTGSTGGRQGIVRRLTVIGCQTLANVFDTSLDCHGCCEDVFFIGNMSYGGAGQGIAVRCAKAQVRDNTIMRAATNGIGMINNTTQPTDFQCTGNKVYNVGSGWSGIALSASATTTCGLTQRALHVTGNTVYGGPAVNTVGILVTANLAGVYRNTNVKVSSNSVDNCSSYGIYVGYADYADVSSNQVGDVPSAAYGIRLRSCTYSNIVGGNIRCSNSNGKCVLFETSSANNTIDGVTGTGGTVGVNIDSTSTNNVVSPSCDFTTCTTPVVLGSVVGNVIGIRRLMQALAAPTYSASITLDTSRGAWQTITVTDANAFTVNAPTSPPSSTHSAELTVEVLNSSGGAMGVITWNGAFVFAGLTWTNPANTKKRFARFEWNGLNWICTALATADY